jgi:hypothetical protein
MTDSSNNDNNVQKRREIYELPISLLRLFDINITNLLGRRQFYRWLNKEKSFPSEMTDLIEELIIESIVKKKEKESGVESELIWVMVEKVRFDFFFLDCLFEYPPSPKKWVWLFYLNTTPSTLELLAEQLVSKNIPDFKSLGLPFYSSETIIFLEKSAFGETELSLSIIENHLNKFLKVNRNYKGDLLWAEDEYCGGYDIESESSDDEEETESEGESDNISEEDCIFENWFTKDCILTELKSKSLENLYSDNSESKKVGKKIKDLLIANSTAASRLSKDPVFVVSKDLGELLKLWDSTTEKISLKWKEWVGFLKKKEALDIKLNQELSPLRLFCFLKVQLQKIYCAYEKLKDVEEVIFSNQRFLLVEESDQPFQEIRNAINARLEKCLIWTERLEKFEWEKGDEKKDWREWKKPEYGYQNWKHQEEKLIQYYLTELGSEIVESSQKGSDIRRKLREPILHSGPQKKLEEIFADLSITDNLINSSQTTRSESRNMEKEEKNSIHEQILYQFLRDI